MCATCGCSDESAARVTLLTDGTAANGHRDHSHQQDAPPPTVPHHDHYPPDHPVHDTTGHDTTGHGSTGHETTDRTIVLEQQILAKNTALARHNRDWLAGRGIFAINLMSSPGSGKTTLLEQTIRELGSEMEIGVIEGDQETPLDAERIRATGRPVVQINTGAGCHLDASMLHDALHVINASAGSVIFIENVGNLVCPALFDLGETRRVVLISVTEGADKPLKYPHMFRAADLVLVNKVDLLPYVNFDLGRFEAYLRQINPTVPFLTVTATTGGGIAGWLRWLRPERARLTPANAV
jgi:hydrogenase nickel incorporation protein HypB